MSKSCTVLIASPDLLPSLTQRAREANSELLAFSDADALRALEVITRRRPRVVALERLFAATPRGAALINRIKADPSLSQLEIRVVSHDSNDLRGSPRRSDEAAAAAAAVQPAGVGAPPAPLDQRGTRRAPRFTIAAGLEVMVDGNAAALVDLSTFGAQVVSATVLKPNQRVRVILTDEHGTLRCSGAVAWASFEIPPARGPRYRAGIEFVDASASAVDAFCARHKV